MIVGGILALQKVDYDMGKDASDNLHISGAGWPYWIVAFICYYREVLIFWDI